MPGIRLVRVRTTREIHDVVKRRAKAAGMPMYRYLARMLEDEPEPGTGHR